MVILIEKPEIVNLIFNVAAVDYVQILLHIVQLYKCAILKLIRGRLHDDDQRLNAYYKIF